MHETAILAGIEIGWSHPVRLIGVLNVSPESFYAGSVRTEGEALARRAREMVAEGADILDVGAKSTAPYRHTDIGEEEERERMEWAIRTVAAAVRAPLAADTQRASVAAVALAYGARIVNDTSGLRADPPIAEVAAQAEGVILMASEEGPSHEEPIDLCSRLLEESLQRATRAGIPRQAIVLDPGIGFFRRGRVSWDEFDLAVLRDLRRLGRFGHPLLVGVSRKSFIGKLTGREEPGERLWGSLAATAVAVANGAAAVRTHDVAATRDAVRVAERLRRPGDLS